MRAASIMMGRTRDKPYLDFSPHLNLFRGTRALETPPPKRRNPSETWRDEPSVNCEWENAIEAWKWTNLENSGGMRERVKSTLSPWFDLLRRATLRQSLPHFNCSYILVSQPNLAVQKRYWRTVFSYCRLFSKLFSLRDWRSLLMFISKIRTKKCLSVANLTLERHRVLISELTNHKIQQKYCCLVEGYAGG